MNATFENEMQELLTDVENRLRRAAAAAERLSKSSLEAKLGRALVLSQLQFGPAVVVSNDHGAPIGHGFYIVPQFRVLSYSADFALFLRSGNASVRLLVEADGAYWHDRTAEQVERDQRRDSALRHTGWPVSRFSVAAIRDDAQECAAAAWERLYASWRMKTHCVEEFSESPA